MNAEAQNTSISSVRRIVGCSMTLMPISRLMPGPPRRLLVYKGSERFPMRGGVEATPLTLAMNEIGAAVQA